MFAEDLDHEINNAFEFEKIVSGPPSMIIPTRSVMSFIGMHSKQIVEIGAGTGFFAKYALAAGLDVIATDIGEPETWIDEEGVKSHLPAGSIGAYTAVEILSGTSAVDRYAGRDVMLIMPNPGYDWPIEILQKLECGRRIFFCPDHPLDEQEMEDVRRTNPERIHGFHSAIGEILRSDYRMIGMMNVMLCFGDMVKLYCFERIS